MSAERELVTLTNACRPRVAAGAAFFVSGGLVAALLSPETPAFAVPEANLVPVSDHLGRLTPIPPSRMFLINKSLKVFQEKQPGVPVFDASQGDGGASLPGVPRASMAW